MDQNIGLQTCRRLPLNPQMFIEIELKVSEETNKMTNEKSERDDHAPTSVKTEGTAQNVVLYEPQLGSSRTLNVSDLLLP